MMHSSWRLRAYVKPEASALRRARVAGRCQGIQRHGCRSWTRRGEER